MAYRKSLQIMIFDTPSDMPETADDGQIAYCLDIKNSFTFANSSWNPSSRTIVKKSIANINGKSTGLTKIYTLENTGLTFYPITVVFRAVSVSGVVTAPTMAVGSNASSYNNIVASSLLSNVLATLGAGGGAPQTANFSPALAGGTEIYANVSIGAIASNYTFQIEIIGFYDN